MIDTMLDQAIAAHREGRAEEARTLYEGAISEEPGNAHAHRCLGRLEFESGRYQVAVRRFQTAVKLAPDQPATQADLSRALAAGGRYAQAAVVLEALLERAGDDPEVRFNLALLRLNDNEPARATEQLERVLAASPRHARALHQLGRLRSAAGRGDEAESLFGRAVAADPDDPEPLLSLAGLLADRGEGAKAAGLLERVIALPALDRPDAHVRLSRVLETQGETERALQVAVAGTEAYPGHDIAWRHLGDLRKRLGQLDAAVEAFERAHAILRTPGTNYGFERPEIRRTKRAKLQHDIDQLTYLRDRGLRGMDVLLAEHQRLAAGLPPSLGDGDVVGLAPATIFQAGGHYNRCLHRAEAPAIKGGVLNPALDPAGISADYRNRAPGITWIDEFLRPAAVESLRRYLLGSTIWYDADHPNGYVGAYLHDGFTCPLVLQIARELPALLPEIFGDRPLLQLWAYHYDSRLAGIGMHADFAAVNVNFWLTPTEAMLDPDSGGMMVWDKEAPKDWTHHDYNTADPGTKRRIDDFLTAEGANQIRIPHRQNRVVIFNSDLFHRTDEIRFREGFENRRINVTMLYGYRDRE